MTYYVQIKPQGYLLEVNAGESVLEAALRQGFDFPFSCGSATCGTCMGQVLSGTIDYGQIQPYALDEQQRNEGYALFCSAKPTSDLMIQVEDVYGPEYRPPRKLEYRVRDFKQLNNDIYQVFLAPVKNNLEYCAGQYLQIITDDGMAVPFSIANAPSSDKQLELHVKSVPNNALNVEILNKMFAKATLTVRGPYGTVIYQPTPQLPIIYIAGGTGIVPIQAMLAAAFANHDTRLFYLYWGAKTQADLYLHTALSEWTKQHNNFKFIPVVSGQDAYWQGKTGLVHEVIVEQHHDLSGFQVYAAGPTEMVYAAFDVFTQQGLKSQLMFSDTFSHFPRS